jgi:hypothetical protein
MNEFNKEKAASEFRVIADKLTRGEVSGFVCGIGKPGGKFELVSHFDAESYDQTCSYCGNRIDKSDVHIESQLQLLSNRNLNTKEILQ